MIKLSVILGIWWYHWGLLFGLAFAYVVNMFTCYGQIQVTVFSRFCYALVCNHEYIHCLNHRQAKDYITRRNETKRKL